MVLMNLVAGWYWRCRHKEQACGCHGEGEGGTDKLRE